MELLYLHPWPVLFPEGTQTAREDLAPILTIHGKPQFI
jgi:hypothetical protein